MQKQAITPTKNIVIRVGTIIGRIVIFPYYYYILYFILLYYYSINLIRFVKCIKNMCLYLCILKKIMTQEWQQE
jgi:hypothetical protein